MSEDLERLKLLLILLEGAPVLPEEEETEWSKSMKRRGL